MDLFAVPGSHFDQLDQPYAEVCGALIMTTASITYRSQYAMMEQPEPRSRPQQRLIDWMKQALDLSMCSPKGRKFCIVLTLLETIS